MEIEMDVPVVSAGMVTSLCDVPDFVRLVNEIFDRSGPVRLSGSDRDMLHLRIMYERYVSVVADRDVRAAVRRVLSCGHGYLIGSSCEGCRSGDRPVPGMDEPMLVVG